MRLHLPLWVYRIRPIRWLLRITLWRLLEKETGQPDTYGSPNYKYGKVEGQYPDVKVMTETTESPYVCCGYCTAGMACRTAKDGLSSKMNSTAHPIRSEGGRPHDAGNNASELRTGADRAWNVNLDAIAVSEIPDRLRGGYAVTAALDYVDLPDYLKVQSGSFGHAVMLRGWKEDGDYVGFFDPLWPQDARGAWAKWGDIKPALWSDGNHSTTTKKLTKPEPEPPDPEPEPEPKPPAPPVKFPPPMDAVAWNPAAFTPYLWNAAKWGCEAFWYIRPGRFPQGWADNPPIWDSAEWGGGWV